jgi:hypothetical protein
VIVATHEYPNTTCAWDKVSFCATESLERSYFDWTCHCDDPVPDPRFDRPRCKDGFLGVGVVGMPCYRDTDGLVVPGSDRRGACDGEGPIGTRAIAYKVCRGGHAVAATRTEPCRK